MAVQELFISATFIKIIIKFFINTIDVIIFIIINDFIYLKNSHFNEFNCVFKIISHFKIIFRCIDHRFGKLFTTG